MNVLPPHSFRRRLRSRLVALVFILGVILPISSPAYAAATRCRDFDEIPVALAPGQLADQTIAATLCTPPNPRGVQILLHGSTYNRDYWDFPYRSAIYSYTAAAHRAGFATLTVDRLGYGESSHPHSTQVNWDTGAYTLSQLVGKLRGGELGTTFTKVITVGHSMGSLMAVKEAALYGDVDAVVVTGSAHGSGPAIPGLIASFYPAVEDPKFAGTGLDEGYTTTRPGTRGAFYDRRSADPKVIAKDEQLKDTSTRTESANLGTWRNTPPESSLMRDLTIPVLVVLGANDGLVCGGPTGVDCSSRNTIYQNERPHYPRAALTTMSVPLTGHDLNLHWTAPVTYLGIQSWAREI